MDFATILFGVVIALFFLVLFLLYRADRKREERRKAKYAADKARLDQRLAELDAEREARRKALDKKLEALFEEARAQAAAFEKRSAKEKKVVDRFFQKLKTMIEDTEPPLLDRLLALRALLYRAERIALTLQNKRQAARLKAFIDAVKTGMLNGLLEHQLETAKEQSKAG